MSGGFFDYKNHLLNDWAEQLRQLIVNNGKEDEYGYSQTFSSETLSIFYSANFFCQFLEAMLHEIDYVIEGDSSEENLGRNIALHITTLLEREKDNLIHLAGPDVYGFILSHWIKPEEPEQMELF